MKTPAKPQASAPLFTKEEEDLNERTAVATFHRLETTARTVGVQAALAEAIGMSYGIAHLCKALGLVEIHRALRKDLASYMKDKEG